MGQYPQIYLLVEKLAYPLKIPDNFVAEKHNIILTSYFIIEKKTTFNIVYASFTDMPI